MQLIRLASRYDLVRHLLNHYCTNAMLFYAAITRWQLLLCVCVLVMLCYGINPCLHRVADV